MEKHNKDKLLTKISDLEKINRSQAKIIQQKKNDLADCTEKYLEAKVKLQIKTMQISDLDAKVSNLQSSKSGHKSEIFDLKAKIEELEKSKHDSDATVRDKENLLIDLRKKYFAVVKEKKDLGKENEDNVKKLNLSVEENENLKRRESEANETIQKLEAGSKKIVISASPNDKAHAHRIQRKIESLVDQKRKLKVLGRHYRSKSFEDHQKLTQLEQEKAQIINNNEKVLAQKGGEIESLEKKVEELNSSLQEQEANFESEKDTLNKSVSSLREVGRKYKKMHQDNIATLKEKEDDNMNLSHMNEGLQKEIRKMKDELASKNIQVNETVEKLAANIEENQALRQKMEKLERMQDEKDSKIEQEKANRIGLIKKLTTEKQALQVTVEDNERKIRRLENELQVCCDKSKQLEEGLLKEMALTAVEKNRVNKLIDLLSSKENEIEMLCQDNMALKATNSEKDPEMEKLKADLQKMKDCEVELMNCLRLHMGEDNIQSDSVLEPASEVQSDDNFVNILDNVLDERSDRISELESIVELKSQSISRLSTENTNLKKDHDQVVGELEQKLDLQRITITVLNTEKAELSKSKDNLEAKISDLEGKVTKDDNNVMSLPEQNELLSQMSQLENSLNHRIEENVDLKRDLAEQRKLQVGTENEKWQLKFELESVKLKVEIPVWNT